jgi:predicted histone-like DNA-binding protein
MAISYSLVKKKDLSPGAADDDRLYYAQAKSTRTCSFEELCEEAADTSTLSSGDLKLAVDRVLRTLVKSLGKGEVVHMGELGNFQLLASSRGAVTAEEFSASHLKRPHLLFRPGAKLRQMIATVAYERFTVKETECKRPHEEETA